MDTEPFPVRFRNRRGIALFVVLGVIVLVTLLGFVGLTLAGKDQSLSGDFADIKSTEQVGLAGLQLAINRLQSNPANLVTQLNAFIQDGRSRTPPVRKWLNLTGANVTAVTADPDWNFLSTLPGDKSAVKVQILAISQGPDTANVPTNDSEAIYIALRCDAMGRHGDLRTVQGTYRIHGVSLAFSQSAGSYVVPNYALYLGGSLASSNLAADITGDVYVNGGAGSFVNGSSNMKIAGVLKWNGDFSANAPLTIDSNAYIKGALYTNGGAPLTVNGNLGLGDGFKTMNTSLSVLGNLWVGGRGDGTNWSGNASLTVGGDLVFGPSGNQYTAGLLRVGGNAWFLSGLRRSNMNGPGDSVLVGGSLYLTDSVYSGVPFAFDLNGSGGGGVRAGKNFVSIAAPILKFGTSATQYVGLRVQDSLYLAGNASYLHATAGRQADTVGAPNRAFMSHPKYIWPPAFSSWTPDTNLQNTAVVANPMDSVKVDNFHSPQVAAHVVHLDNALFTAAGVTSVGTFSAPNLNRIYRYLDSTRQTYNGYMILLMDGTTSISTFLDDDPSGFTGKALYIVKGSWTPGNGWPHSHTIANIQIIDIGNGGSLASWGWKQGNFAGIFYWENPPCAFTLSLAPIPTAPAKPDTIWGSIIIGQHMVTNWGPYVGSSCGGAGPAVTPNGSAITLIKSDAVYQDIGQNLPGVLQSALDASGNPIHPTNPMGSSQTTPLLRQVTDKPFFEPVGIYR